MIKFLTLMTGIMLHALAYGQTVNPVLHSSSFTNNLFAPGDSIQYTNLKTCEQDVKLTAIVAGSNPKYQWLKSNVAIVSATSKDYIAKESGRYSVEIEVGGKKDTLDHVDVRISALPEADFTFSADMVCSNTPIRFTNTSKGTGLTYKWEFGDPESENNTSNTINPTHEFVGKTGNGNQSFNVKLIAISSDGCTDTVIQKITTKQLPEAGLGGTGSTTYNGKLFFTVCTSTASVFDFFNESKTLSTNTDYRIIWGDASADYTSTKFKEIITHNYPVGIKEIKFVVTGSNGCKDTGQYNVFVGSNPAVGLGNPGNTNVCTGSPLTFPITGTDNNPPGTTYTLSFNDGSESITYNHPAPTSATHVFKNPSCGTSSSNGGIDYPNSFYASVFASNPCSKSSASVVPIYVSSKPSSAFSIGPNDTVCVGITTRISNTSPTASIVSSNGVCTNGKIVWIITPSTGFTIVNGSLGNDRGSDNQNQWTAGSDILDLNFTTPGTYTVKLRVGGSELCGSSDIIKTICVNPKPTAAFTLDQNIGCGPLTVKPTNNSNSPLCGQNSYLWTVTYAPAQGCTPEIAKYSFAGGTSANSKDPQILFENPGIYTIKLRTNGPGTNCFAESGTQTITIKAKPVLNLNNIPGEICQNSSISPIATLNCFPSNPADYKWDFQNGTPLSSDKQSPGNVFFNTAGQSMIKVSSTNDCGTTTVQRTITIKPTPAVKVPENLQLCAGTSTGNLSFTSNPVGATFSWTNSDPSIGLPVSGEGNIPSFMAINNTATQKVVTISVAANLNGCRGVESSFKITIDPKPAAPVAPQLLTYCIGSEAVPLTANSSNGNSLLWYNNKELTNPVNDAPTPVTTAQGSFKYYVVQQGTGGCKSDAIEITVNVNPGISNNKIGNNQTICGGNPPSILSSLETLNGGAPPYTYQWSSSTDGGVNWTDIPGATESSFAPPVLNADIKYKRKVAGGQCISESNIVDIKVLGSLTNFNIKEAQVICANEIPSSLIGETPVGGNGNYSYQWEVSNDGISWTVPANANSKDYSPEALITSKTFRRKVSSGECSVYSNEIKITVNPIPVTAQVPDNRVCINSSVPAASLVTIPFNNISYAWANNNPLIGLSASGTGVVPSFISSNSSKKPLTGNISVIPTYTANGKACAGDTVSYAVTVLPKISIAPVKDTAVCSDAFIPAFTPIHDAELIPGVTIRYRYTVSGTGSTLNNGTGPGIPSFTVNNPGNTDLIVTITVTLEYEFNGKTCDGNSLSYTVTIKPGTPEGTGGPDAELCAATSYTMKALSSSGTNGEWKQVSGPAATIASTNSPTSIINGLSGGNVYKFVWTVKGFATCPPAIDTVTIDNKAELINSIESTPVVICAGQSVAIAGGQPAGGNNSYSYQWQQSTDGNNYVDIAGANSRDLFFLPAQTVYVRRLVNSLPCSNNSNAVLITVQAALSNNIIRDNKDVCINTDAGLLTGSLPSGGNGDYIFEWQSSPDNGTTWSNIPGATTKDYLPGVLVQTTSYRRLISTALCNGPQSGISNVIKVTIRPDAVAEFNPVQTDACPPFIINSTIVGLKVYPDINSEYQWFLDGAAAGSGQNFPGHTMFNADDTITIKLVTQSAYGCKPDSISRQFITYKVPEPLFTLSDSVGCGPLSVAIKNTTPQQGLFTYVWDFGNGQTFSSIDPGTIVFDPNPNNGDTVYIITLKAISKCDTVSISKSIRIKSKPKSLFAPSKSVGCSPMTVSFNNISRGLGVKYTIDYGDGTRKELVDDIIPEHTFTVATRDTFYVKLIAENECGFDSSSYSIIVSPNTIKLDVAVNGNEVNGCVPNTVRFINNSRGASSFVYSFGDGNTYATSKNIDTVTHRYEFPGTFTVRIRATNGCSDTSTYETITVFPKPTAGFNLDKQVICANDSISATNLSDSANSYAWNFGNGIVSNKVHPVFTYDQSGEYMVTLKAYRVNGFGNICVDSVSRKVSVESPYGKINYDPGTLCNDLAARFEADVSFTDSLIWNFGDGTILRTKERIVFHRYLFSGSFVPVVTLVSKAGCTSILKGADTIRVDKIKSGFVTQMIQECGRTIVYFTDTSRSSSGMLHSNWLTGDGISLSGKTISKTFTVNSDYTIRLIAESVLGCYDTTFRTISVPVFSVPKVQVSGQTEICSNEDLKLSANVQSGDPVISYLWKFSNGATFSEKDIQTKLNPGNYSVELIVRTNNGCADTTSADITIKKSPDVSVSNDVTICKGSNTFLQATGGVAYSWSPDTDISCTDCNVVLVNPAESRTYQVIGSNDIGCADTASAFVTVIQPFRMIVTGRDSICIGQSTQMLVTGGATYSWSPENFISNSTSGNPVFNPDVTTLYRVIGYDGKNCFTDTAFVTIAVGEYPTVNLGPDQVLPTGTLYPLKSTITNGPITKWEWTPNRNIDCADCAEPIATVKTNTSYTVKVTSAYGCSAMDTIAIKAFCVNTQVYIPNAFTPDGDGLNDKLIVRGSGIQTVKYFRIFNRWGELVFERSNFSPNDPSFGWDGKVRGNDVKPDVYVFTAEVLCDDGSPYVYKGNVSLLK